MAQASSHGEHVHAASFYPMMTSEKKSGARDTSGADRHAGLAAEAQGSTVRLKS
ncbi:MAG TPA: hypothetical protein VFX41_00740 [Actinomycetales bacterium]|nr:hypothetical protein [Actinomycetales bacterium]